MSQRLRMLADLEIAGEEFTRQTITHGNFTNTECITGMQGINVGLNVRSPFRIELD